MVDVSKGDAEFEAEFLAQAWLDNSADAAIRAELAQLWLQLDEFIRDRVRRLLALVRLVPQARDEHDALAQAGLTWADTGLPEGFDAEAPWLPKELSEARKLLAWLFAHPPSLPQADPSEIWPAGC